MPQAIGNLFTGKPRGAPDDLIFLSRNGKQIAHISKSFDMVVSALKLNDGISG